MVWELSHDPGEFLTAAGGFLRARPDRNTVLLSVSASLVALGADLYGADEPVFGWWRARPDGDVAGAWLWTPPHAVSVSAMPPEAADALPAVLAGLDPPPAQVRGEEALAGRVAAGLADRTGTRTGRLVAERLYRLAQLNPPHPAPPGRARPAHAGDRDLLLEWMRRFQADIGHGAGAANPRRLDARLAGGEITLWETEGRPVSMAALGGADAGAARIGPVYTPTELRGRGYAGAAVTAAARRGLDDGLRQILLFADLANPTSNALYARLGFVPVEDCAHFVCRGAGAEAGTRAG